MSVTVLDYVASVPIAVVIRLITIGATLACGRHAPSARRVSLIGSMLASIVTTTVAVQVIASSHPIGGVLFRHVASGIALTYAVTPLSAWFLLVLGVVAVPVAIYSLGYFAHAIPGSRIAQVGILLNVLLGAVEVVFVASDVIAFLFGWELMTLATAALVATEHEARASRRAAYLFLVMSHVGTGCLVAGFLWLVGAAGSLSFASILTGHVVAGSARTALFVVFVIGFGVKAGVVPLHVWLPEAHPAAPSSISALMSAVLITTGLYGLFRVCAFGLGAPDLAWGLAFMAIGAVSAVLGVLYALAQNDIKRLLAYSTIENAGVVVLALGAAMTALSLSHADLASIAVAAALAHILNHAVFKGLLFLGAGSVVMGAHTRHIEQLGGLLRNMPWTGLCFLVGAAAISGLPPLNGFASEWLLFQALLQGFASTPGMVRLSFPLSGAIVALTTALVAACFVKAFGITFLARPRTQAAAEAHEAPLTMLIPQAVLAAGCIGLGLFPGRVLRAVSGVLTTLPGLNAPLDLAGAGGGMMIGHDAFDHVVPLLVLTALLGALLFAATLTARRATARRRVPTWACGGSLTAQHEYTSTAFSKPLMLIFRTIYRPTREVEALAEVSPYFPSEVRYRASIEPTFERYVYAPLLRGVLRMANGMKVLQAGSLHAYLAYVLLLGVLLLVWLGGTT